MNLEKIREAKLEAKRFLKKADEAEKKLKECSYAHRGCKETGAMKRASLDLTRALAELRKP